MMKFTTEKDLFDVTVERLVRLNTRGILSVPLVTALASWMKSRLLTLEIRCRSTRVGEVCEGIRASKTGTHFMCFLLEIALHTAQTCDFAGADCRECSSCIVGEVHDELWRR